MSFTICRRRRAFERATKESSHAFRFDPPIAPGASRPGTGPPYPGAVRSLLAADHRLVAQGELVHPAGDAQGHEHHCRSLEHTLANPPLALDRPGGRPADELLLQHDEQNHHRLQH